MTALSHAMRSGVSAALTTVGAGFGRIMGVVFSFLVALLLWAVIALAVVLLTEFTGTPMSVPGVLQLSGTSILPHVSPNGVQIDPHPLGFPVAVTLTAALLIGLGVRTERTSDDVEHAQPRQAA